MMLGDLLALARRSSGGFVARIAAVDAALAGPIAAAAAQAGIGPAACVRAAVADFDRLASEEDWATLVSRLRGAGDPGTACLQMMVDWWLTAQAGRTAAEEASR